jgi:hypothetical protein
LLFPIPLPLIRETEKVLGPEDGIRLRDSEIQGFNRFQAVSTVNSTRPPIDFRLD